MAVISQCLFPLVGGREELCLPNLADFLIVVAGSCSGKRCRVRNEVFGSIVNPAFYQLCASGRFLSFLASISLSVKWNVDDQSWRRGTLCKENSRNLFGAKCL